MTEIMARWSPSIVALLGFGTIGMILYLALMRMIRSLVEPLATSVDRLTDVMQILCQSSSRHDQELNRHDKILTALAEQDRKLCHMLRRMAGDSPSDPELAAGLEDSDPGRVLRSIPSVPPISANPGT